MKKFVMIAAAMAVTLSLGAAVAHAQSNRTVVSIVVNTTDDDVLDVFNGDLDGCKAGTVENGRANVRFTPRFGVFTGEKVFTCAEGVGGFTVYLTATFDYNGAGSQGSWSVTSGWGSLAGLTGAGKLVGVVTSAIGIDDYYSGTVRI